MKNNHDEQNSKDDVCKNDHQKALKEALALLGDLKKQDEPKSELPNIEQEIVDYQVVVETELRNLTNAIHQLQEENLENIAKIQTMARRHNEEEIKTRKYGGARLAQELIPALDLFKKILEIPVKNEEVKNYLMGFDMISKQIDQILSNNGISKIPAKVGDEFDPHLHEATEVVETTEIPSGKIAAINSNGYKLHDRVIKHTNVKVAK